MRINEILPGDLLIEADSIIAAQASRAGVADGRDPLDAYPVSDFPVTLLCARTHFDDLSNALMSADLVRLSGMRKGFPSVRHDPEVTMTYSGVGTTCRAQVSIQPRTALVRRLTD